MSEICLVRPALEYGEEIMTIRHASMEDLEVLLKHDKHISAEELASSIRLQRVYVAQLGGKFIGWLRYNLFWDNTPFMNLLYILEEYQGKGYGRDLVERWEKDRKAQGYQVVMTSTQSDECAQHFYHKLGYRTIGGFLLKKDPFEAILSKELV